MRNVILADETSAALAAVVVFELVVDIAGACCTVYVWMRKSLLKELNGLQGGRDGEFIGEKMGENGSEMMMDYKCRIKHYWQRHW
jgi:hypothetical protein